MLDLFSPMGSVLLSWLLLFLLFSGLGVIATKLARAAARDRLGLVGRFLVRLGAFDWRFAALAFRLSDKRYNSLAIRRRGNSLAVFTAPKDRLNNWPIAKRQILCGGFCRDSALDVKSGARHANCL